MAAGTAGGREIDGAGRKEEARMRFFRIEVCLLQTSRAQFSALFGLPPSRRFLIAARCTYYSRRGREGGGRPENAGGEKGEADRGLLAASELRKRRRGKR